MHSTTPGDQPVECDSISLTNSLTVYYVSASGGGTGERPNSPISFDAALTNIESNSLISATTRGTIVLLESVDILESTPGIGETGFLPFIKPVAIRSMNPLAPAMIQLNSQIITKLFTVGEAGTAGELDLTDVIIQPASGQFATQTLIEIANGTLSLNQGAKLSGNTGNLGGAVRLTGSSATFRLNGGAIENCQSENGGGVLAEAGAVVLNAGHISSCISNISGSAIYAKATATVMAEAGSTAVISNTNTGDVPESISGRVALESLASIASDPVALQTLKSTIEPAALQDITTCGLLLFAHEIGMSVAEPEKLIAAMQAAEHISVQITLGSMMMTNPTLVPNPIQVNNYLSVMGMGAIIGGSEMNVSGIPLDTPTQGALMTGPVFTVNTGGELILDNIKLKGSGENFETAYPLIAVEGGAVTLTNGSNAGPHRNTAAAGGNGGAIAMNAGSVLVGTTASLYSCTAVKGGAVYMTAGSLTLNGTSHIEYCRSTLEGGGLWVGGGEVVINTTYTNAIDAFIDDEPGIPSYGGLIYQSGGTISSSSMMKPHNSFSDVDGAGIYILGGSYSMTGGSLTGCQTTNGQGGAVYVAGTGAGSTGSFTLTGGDIGSTSLGYESEWNKALDGAGIYIGNFGQAQLNGGRIIKNIASASGGGVYIADGGSVLIDGAVEIGATSTDYGNTAVNGGGVYVQATDALNYGTLIMTSGAIGYNTATTAGGGVYLAGGTFTIEGGQIIGNTATTQHGGGVWMNSGATKPAYIDFRQPTITACITANTATAGLGGGVWNQTPSVEPFLRNGSAITPVEINTAISGNTVPDPVMFRDYNTALYQITETGIGTSDTVYWKAPQPLNIMLGHAGLETPVIQLTVTDPADVISTLPLTPTNTQTFINEWTYTGNPFVDQGTYILHISLEYGADSTIIARTVLYDNILPTLAGPVTPTITTVNVSGSLNITVNGLSDTGSGLKELRVLGPWCTGPTMPLTTAQSLCNVTITATQSGIQSNITLELEDLAGNIRTESITMAQQVTVNP